MTRVPLQPRPSGTTDLVVVGENSLDVVVTAAEFDRSRTKRRASGLDLRVGGQATTAAVAAVRLGLRARYVGALGTDEWGETVRRELMREGVEVRVIARVGVPTRAAVIVVEPDGERVVHEHCHPDLPLRAAEVDPVAIETGRVLLVDATSLDASMEAVRIAREAGLPTIVDVDRVGDDVEALLDGIDVIIVPEPFVTEWNGGGATQLGLVRLAARFPRALAVVATCGAAGAVAHVGGQLLCVPGYVVPVTDTTGAGDAFRGGFAAAWIQLGAAATMESLLEHANATAAINCRAVGAQTGLPSWDQVRALVTGRGHVWSN